MQNKKKVIFTMLALFFVVLFLILSYWQYSRASEKNELEKKLSKRGNAPPLAWSTVSSELSKYYYHLVCLSGRFDNGRQFLLDNRFHAHHLGYVIYTPFITPGNRVLIVNRGWVPRSGQYPILPKISSIHGKQKICGMLYPGQKRSFTLGSQDMINNKWPKVIQNVMPAHISKQLKTAVFPVYLLLKHPKNYRYVENWQVFTMKAAKHFGYAVQWLFMAIAVFIMYIVFQKRSHKE